MFIFEGCSEDFLYLFRSLPFRYIILVHWSRDHFVIAKLVFIFYIYTFDEVVITFSHISSCVVFFLFFLYTCFLSMYAIFIFVSY